MNTPFASRLTRQPIAFDPAIAAEVAADFADLAPELAQLLANTAGCSPFLRGQMQREAAWLREALTADPRSAAATVLTALDAHNLDTLPTALRVAKRAALRC